MEMATATRKAGSKALVDTKVEGGTAADAKVAEAERVKAEGPTTGANAGATPAVLKKRTEVRLSFVTDVKSWLDAEKKRAEIVKSMATDAIQLRTLYRYDGDPDWAGRSAEYKAELAEIFRIAGVPADSQGQLGNTIRKQVGNQLRDVILKFHKGDEKAARATMAKHNLTWETTNERQQARQTGGAVGSGAVGAVPAGGRVQVPGVTVSAPVGDLAVAMAKALAKVEASGAVLEATKAVRTARGFGIPGDETERATLLAALQTLITEAQAWCGEIAMFVAAPETETETPDLTPAA